jgi:hypothetical protein
MPIVVAGKTLNRAAAEVMLGNGFSMYRPAGDNGLIDSLLEKWIVGTKQKTFASEQAFREAVHESALRKATDVEGLGELAWQPSEASSQMKKVFVAAHPAGTGRLTRLTTEKGSLANLRNEASALDQLKRAGLRVAPVYGAVQEDGNNLVMYERWVAGNFLDLAKEDYTQKQQVALLGSFYGLTVPRKETGAGVDGVQAAIMQRFGEGDKPSRGALDKATSDFTKIQEFFNSNMYISDLQGIMEFRSGRFFIIDPMGVFRTAEVTGGEINMLDHTKAMIDAVLGHFKAMMQMFRYAQ